MTTIKGFPPGSQYAEALQHPDQCFRDPELRSASIEKMAMGLPRMISGNFASVFPVTSATGHRYAVKCFTRTVPNQLERYELISSRLSTPKPWWATDFQFMPDGIQVNGSRYPILRMNWVKGRTLTHWINDKIRVQGAMASLAQRFDELVRDLTSTGIAHGDLQAGNLLITDDTGLHLVDYDGMYVAGLEKLPPDEVGHPDYQPPHRSRDDYGPDMDRFSAWLISLSLKIMAAAPELWDQCNPGHDEYLLLNRNDLRDPAQSGRLAILTSHRNAEVRRLALMMRPILSLPMRDVPVLAIPAAQAPETPAPSPVDAAHGLPGWMRSRIPEPAQPPVTTGAGSVRTPSPPGPGAQVDRWLTWLTRVLIALPLTALAGIGDPPASLGVFITTSLLVILALGVLYRSSSFRRAFTELKRERRRARLREKQSARRMSRAETAMAETDRRKSRLIDRHSKAQAALRADFGRKKQRESHEVEGIDLQLAQLGDRKLHEITRRLVQYQQSFVTGQLHQAVLRADDIRGVGAQLVGRLQAVGIRTAADFTGVGLYSNGRSTTVLFYLTSGRPVSVVGIGKVKADRIDQWRRARVTSAVAAQPAVLPPSELGPIETRFAADERILQGQRAQAAQQIANRIAQIDSDLNAAADELRSQQQAELASLDQRRAEQAARLGEAYSDRLAGEQAALDWQQRIASAARPTFGHFVSVAVRGRSPGHTS